MGLFRFRDHEGIIENDCEDDDDDDDDDVVMSDAADQPRCFWSCPDDNDRNNNEGQDREEGEIIEKYDNGNDDGYHDDEEEEEEDTHRISDGEYNDDDNDYNEYDNRYTDGDDDEDHQEEEYNPDDGSYGGDGNQQSNAKNSFRSYLNYFRNLKIPAKTTTASSSGAERNRTTSRPQPGDTNDDYNSSNSETNDPPRDGNNYRDEHHYHYHSEDQDRTHNRRRNWHKEEEEYRLIGSTRYDRDNYDEDDFYHHRRRNSSSGRNEGGYRAEESDPSTSIIPFPMESTSSSMAQQQQERPPEIHYHIYIPESQAARWFDGINGNGNLIENCNREDAEPETNRKGQRFPFPLWKTVAVLAVLMHLVLYGFPGGGPLLSKLLAPILLPLAPPPPGPYRSWEEYTEQQRRLIQQISYEGYALTRHLLVRTVTAATAGRVVFDDDDDYRKRQEPTFVGYEFPKDWSSLVPTVNYEHNDAKRDTARLRLHLFGQDAAVEKLKLVLNRWVSSLRRSRRDTGTTEGTDGHGPLFLYVTGGGPSVGKRTVAYVLLDRLVFSGEDDSKNDASSTFLSNYFYGKKSDRNEDSLSLSLTKLCANSNRRETTSPLMVDLGCPLLHLKPSDHDYSPDLLYEQILNHHRLLTVFTKKNPSSSFSREGVDEDDHYYETLNLAASIVLLENVDADRRGNQREDNNNADDDNDTNNKHSDWLQRLLQRIQDANHAAGGMFDSTIFVMTSSVGTKTMEKWTRKRLLNQHNINNNNSSNSNNHHNHQHSRTEIDSLLRYEIRTYHSSVDPDRHPSSGDYDSLNDRDNFFDGNNDNFVIVPMVPLDRSAMKSILGRIASMGNTVIINHIEEDDSGSDYHSNDQSKYDISHDFATTCSTPSMVISESASERILDGIEWYQWAHKSSPEQILRVWSPNGAQPLIRFWTRDVMYDRILQNQDCVDFIREITEHQRRYYEHGRYRLLLDYEQEDNELDLTVTEVEFVIRSCTEILPPLSTGHWPKKAVSKIIRSSDQLKWSCQIADGSTATASVSEASATLLSKSCRFYL